MQSTALVKLDNKCKMDVKNYISIEIILGEIVLWHIQNEFVSIYQ